MQRHILYTLDTGSLILHVGVPTAITQKAAYVDCLLDLLLCNVKRIIKWMVKSNRVKDECILPYIFSSFILSCFCFVFDFVRKITMIALERCNPYSIKAQVNLFWRERDLDIEKETQIQRYRLQQKDYRAL